MNEAPRLLFAPVSGPFGMGEYARSLAIANGAKRRWPDADIRFLLSEQAPYAATAPFRATLLPSSPTFHSAAVIGLLTSMRPHVTVFDNAGRTQQLRAAQRLGSRVVFISARSRQRRKAFRWRWMRLIDEHWIAYPQFIAGRFTALERLKLALLHRPAVRYLDVILSRPAPGRDALLERLRLEAGTYLLVVPGGGTGHPRAADAAQTFLSVAHSLAASGIVTVFVGPTAARDAGAALERTLPAPPLRSFHSLPQADLGELMRGAGLVLVNGGSTLLQAIAGGVACVAVPIARDQGQRIRRCVAAHVACGARLDAPSMTRTASALWHDAAARTALARRAAALALADGVEIALRELASLLSAGGGPA